MRTAINPSAVVYSFPRFPAEAALQDGALGRSSSLGAGAPAPVHLPADRRGDRRIIAGAPGGGEERPGDGCRGACVSRGRPVGGQPLTTTCTDAWTGRDAVE